MNSEIQRPSLYELGVMTETDPTIIDRQVVEGVEAVGIVRFLNNFPEYLVGGAFRQPDSIAGSAYAARLYSSMLNPNSERAKWVTYSGFFGDIDKAQHDAAKAGLFDQEKFSELRANRLASDEAWTACIAYTLPVYVRLRQMGYGHYDLFG